MPTGVYLEVDEYQVEDDIISPTGSVYTDGCGEIPYEKASGIAKALGLSHIPSAFQVRWGPCKGVLVVNPNIQKVIFRRSMLKFTIPNPSKFQKEIEVIRYSSAISAHLNREFIPLFSYLGVPDQVFEKLQNEAVQAALSLREYFGTKGT